MKNNLKILAIVFLLSANSLFAQTGFQGKRNEISLDVFSLAYFNELHFTYKFALSKYYALYGKYSTGSFSRDMSDPRVYDLVYVKDQYDNTQIEPGDIVSGKTDFKSSSYEFGVLLMKRNFGTSLPIGFYTALGFEISNGEMTDIYTFKEGISGSGNPQKYDVSQFKLVGYTGWDIILTGNLTLDISLEFGAAWGKYEYQPTALPALLAEEPYATFPQIPFIGHNEKEDWGMDYDDLGYLSEYKALNILIMPSIKVGYIF